MSSVAFLLNVSSVCFFVCEVFSFHRRTLTREKLDSTSLEGHALHAIRNMLFVVASAFLCAWISVVANAAETIFVVLTVYWKLQWLRKNFTFSRFRWVSR